MVQRQDERLTQIFQEVLVLAQRFGRVDWDEEEGMWLFIHQLPLPPQYAKKHTACLINIPAQYPQIPPAEGSFVDPDLGIQEQAYHRKTLTFRDKELRWLCAHLKGWKPKQPWTKGHSLITVVEAVMYQLNLLKR
jgi:hypothetical protein